MREFLIELTDEELHHEEAVVNEIIEKTSGETRADWTKVAVVYDGNVMTLVIQEN